MSDERLTALEHGEVRPYPRDSSIQDLVAAWARRTPDAIALRFRDATVTYSQLVRDARRVAGGLGSVGVGPGDVVAVLDLPSARRDIVYLGILSAGAAYLPLDESNPPDRNATMVAAGRAATVLTTAEHAGSFSPAVEIDSLAAWPGPAGGAAPAPASCSGSDIAYLMFTSGSTGTPKGVAIPHRAIARLVINTDYVDLSPSDVVAHGSNASFDAATFEIWGALLNGGTLVGLSKEEMLVHQDLRSFLSGSGATTLFLTPAVFHAHAAEAPATFSGLRNLLIGGDVLDAGAAAGVLRAGAPGQLLNM
jgi:non-ribosomal peptide synthetase component F